MQAWLHVETYFSSKESLNNYVDKKRGEVSCMISAIIHSRGVGGQNWVKFGPRSC